MLKWRFALSIILFGFFARPLLAEEPGDYFLFTARGVGKTQHEASVDALRSAVLEVGGENLASALDPDGWKEAPGGGGQQFADARDATRGVIHSFRRIRSGQTDGRGEAFVEIEVRVPVVGAAEKVPRFRVAVIPQSFDRRLVQEPYISDFALDLSTSIESALVQTRRFDLIDNGSRDWKQADLGPLTARGVNSPQVVELARRIPADLLVVAHVRDFSLEQDRVNFRIDLRVIEASTGRIRFARTQQGSANLGRRIGLPAVADRIGGRLARAISSAIYPVAVVAVGGDTVTFNEGGQFIKAGSQYRLSLAGAELVDPYTGESLGTDEMTVAEVEVYKVTDRISMARVVSGSLPKRFSAGALIGRGIEPPLEERMEEFREAVEEMRRLVRPQITEDEIE